MYKVTIEGFKNKDEAEQFIHWYEGQGEQDIDIWLECRRDEGMDIRQYLTVDCPKTYQHNKPNTKNGIEWIGDTAMMYIKE